MARELAEAYNNFFISANKLYKLNKRVNIEAASHRCSVAVLKN